MTASTASGSASALASASTAQRRAAMEAGDMEELLPKSSSASSLSSSQKRVGPSTSSSSSSTAASIAAMGGPTMTARRKTSATTLDSMASGAYRRVISCVATVYAYVMYHYINYRTEFILCCILLLSSAIATCDIVRRERAEKARMHDPSLKSDWTHVQSAMDLKLGKVDHWCLDGGDVACTCEDPLVPSARVEERRWGAAHRRNVDSVREALARKAAYEEEQEEGEEKTGNEGSNVNWWEDDNSTYTDDWPGYFEPKPGDPEYDNAFFNLSEYDIDVAFIGDSITEQRVGKVLGKDQDRLKANAKVFLKSYSKADGGQFDGIGLGISSDTSPNLLWRLMHGEMPPDFNPRVWWVTIGTNDLLRTRCSEEITLMGVLRIVEEILKEKADATVVINSILPLSTDKNGLLYSKRKSVGVGSSFGRGGSGGKRVTNIWPSIVLVNQQLKKFAEGHSRVQFFDATDIFIEKKNAGREIYIDQTLYVDGIHPNAAGYRKWDERITKKLGAIVQKKNEDEMAEKEKEGVSNKNKKEWSGGLEYTYDDVIFNDAFYGGEWGA